MQYEKRSYIEDFQLEVEKGVAKIKGKHFYFLWVFFPICSGENLFGTVGIKCGELIIKFSHSGRKIIFQKVQSQFGELKQPFVLW